MAQAPAKQTPSEVLEKITTQVEELRQTEALESQVHEMVLAKRHKLDLLLSQFIDCAAEFPAPAPAIQPGDLPGTIVQPASPSAQQVLDSLNRLMSGLKDMSVKQGAVGA